MDRQHWIEKVRKTDALRLRCQPEKCTIAIEAPGSTNRHDLEA